MSTTYEGKQITTATKCTAVWGKRKCGEVAKKLCDTWYDWNTSPPPLPCAHDKGECLKEALRNYP